MDENRCPCERLSGVKRYMREDRLPERSVSQAESERGRGSQQVHHSQCRGHFIKEDRGIGVGLG